MHHAIPVQVNVGEETTAQASALPDEPAAAPQKPMIRAMQSKPRIRTAEPTQDHHNHQRQPGAEPLPDGWEEHVDEATGKPYYSNDDTGEIVWVRPKK